MSILTNGQSMNFDSDMTYRDLIHTLAPGKEKEVLGVRVMGETFQLDTQVRDKTEIELLTYAKEEGRRIYERTLQFVMLLAVRHVLPQAKVRIENSFGKGIYVTMTGCTLTAPLVKHIEDEMRHIVEDDLPIEKHAGTRRDALQYFEETGQMDKVRLLNYRNFEHFFLYQCEDMLEYFYGEMAPSTGYTPVFDLKFYLPGLVLMLPELTSPKEVGLFVDMPKLMRTFSESARWNEILGCANTADLNDMIKQKQLREFIRVNEALHERSIERIADDFVKSGARLILIAGPSSSGKTTFAHRLSIALRVLGKRPTKVSLDNYYIDREKIPVDENGQRDFERLDTLDVDLLGDHLVRLLQGEEIQAPIFDFKSGKRMPQSVPMRVDTDQPIVIEGIHALNDELTYNIPRKMKFKIYISALTTLNLDDHNRIRTTDARLLRRIVRDYLFRGTAPEETIRMWPIVRRGEEKYIFPYQETADVMFNSTLVYELTIMKKYVYPVLRAITPESPEYSIARRLVKFLNYFYTADVEDEIPVNSILREFIGGCCFYHDVD